MVVVVVDLVVVVVVSVASEEIDERVSREVARRARLSLRTGSASNAFVTPPLSRPPRVALHLAPHHRHPYHRPSPPPLVVVVLPSSGLFSLLSCVFGQLRIANEAKLVVTVFVIALASAVAGEQKSMPSRISSSAGGSVAGGSSVKNQRIRHIAVASASARAHTHEYAHLDGNRGVLAVCCVEFFKNENQPKKATPEIGACRLLLARLSALLPACCLTGGDDNGLRFR